MSRANPESASPSQQPPSGQPDPAAAEAALIALYAWAQVAMLTGIARVLSGVPHTREGYQAAMPAMRAVVAQVKATLTVRTGPLVAALTRQAAAAGDATARAQVEAAAVPATAAPAPGTTPASHLPPPPPTTGDDAATAEPDPFDLAMPHGERAAQAIEHDLSSSLANVRERITRLPDDVYKAIAPHGAIQSVLDNGITMRQSQAEAWREFLRHGVTGFTDRAGRRWNLATYTEMAVRTATVRAFNDSHLQRLRYAGIRFFTVPEHATTCPLCWPWEGQVLSDGLQPHPGVAVAGTLAEAVAAGLFHPNCRHTIAVYIPGVSPAPVERPPWGPEQQQQYDDTQRQRALELRVRREREAEALALDAPERARARKRVRAAQAAVRAHIDGKPYLSRDYGREAPHLGYPKVRPPQ